MIFSRSRLAIYIVTLLFMGLIAACNTTPNAPSSSTFQVDAAFADFYKEMGGVNTLGPAISSAFTNDGLTYQYCVSGLMIYDPNQVALKRFRFSPLASAEWKISGLVEPAPKDSSIIYLNGHQIWEEVSSFYTQYNADIIGLPVTGVIANDAKQRYEQYFEGLGFYRKYTDSPGQIHLMPYGVWMCGDKCPYQIADSTPPASTYQRDNSATEQLFMQASEQLGYGFTGAPLAAPRIGPDGNYEMAFENVYLFIDTASGNTIKLRPLPEWLGIQADKPGPERKAEWLSYYLLENGQGYNVPKTFISYINAHGGVSASGAPISDYRTLADDGYSQCFANLCLEYHPSAPKALLIRPHPLGAEYLSLGDNVSASSTASPDALQINAWEDSPLIPSGTIQGINIEVTKNKAPLSGIKFSLVVSQPNGIAKTYTLEPTGEDGKTRIELDPINGPNGAIVRYEICVVGDAALQICFTRSYTIWEQ